MLLSILATLLFVEVASAGAVVGDVYKVVPQISKDADETEQQFYAWIEATQANAGTVDVIIETSFDGQTWLKVAELTQLAAAGSLVELDKIIALGPYLRATATPAGGATVTCKVMIGANKPYKLLRVA